MGYESVEADAGGKRTGENCVFTSLSASSSDVGAVSGQSHGDLGPTLEKKGLKLYLQKGYLSDQEYASIGFSHVLFEVVLLQTASKHHVISECTGEENCHVEDVEQAF